MSQPNQLPDDVLDMARRTDALIRAMAALQVQHGICINHDYDGNAEGQLLDAGDTYYREAAENHSSDYGFWDARQKQWWVIRNAAGRRFVSDLCMVGHNAHAEPETKFDKFPECQWAWLDNAPVEIIDPHCVGGVGGFSQSANICPPKFSAAVPLLMVPSRLPRDAHSIADRGFRKPGGRLPKRIC